MKQNAVVSQQTDLHREMFCVRFVAACISLTDTFVRGVSEIANRDC